MNEKMVLKIENLCDTMVKNIFEVITMSNIAQIDKNFIIDSKIQQPGIKFYDAETEPFKLHGIFREPDAKCFVRLPEEVSKNVSQSVLELSHHTAGGRVRFITDSPYVAINSKFSVACHMSHIAMTGSAGFDIYCNGIYENTFIPPFQVTEDGFEMLKYVGEGTKEITINFPLYACPTKLYIGLDENAKVLPPKPYKIQKPIVYYGSSITQGGCASKPGSSYQSIIERRFDCDYINLGFSGSARGEDAMAEYIAGLDMSLFVYDYDHNAPTQEHLLETHEKMFLKIREKQPNLPIIMMSRPKYVQDRDTVKRLEIIKKTYANAILRGDNNVYLLNGLQLMALVRDNGTVDNCHPTDSGFLSMSVALGDLIEQNYSKIFG